jgi:hypothetical protein
MNMAYHRPSKREREQRKGSEKDKQKSDLGEGNGFFFDLGKPWKLKEYL